MQNHQVLWLGSAAVAYTGRASWQADDADDQQLINF